MATLILKADPQYRIKPMQQVVSALCGGLLTTFVGEYFRGDPSDPSVISHLSARPVTPLEVVKTRVQTQHAIRQRPTVSKLCYVFHNGLMTHVCRSSDICFPKSGRIPHNLRPARGSLVSGLKRDVPATFRGSPRVQPDAYGPSLRRTLSSRSFAPVVYVVCGRASVPRSFRRCPPRSSTS